MLAVLLGGLLASCTSSRDIAYFQSGSSLPGAGMAISNRYVPVIQQADLLSIYINSINPEASRMFNPYGEAERQITTPTQPGQIPAGIGYLVDEEGNVEIPLVGKVKLAGQTTLQAREIIREKLKAFLKEPTVNVRFLNFKISVLGEVGRPSVFVIPNEQITLPEALSLAGDVTIFGRRDNVLIIRETAGRREFARLNLTRRDVFQSPFYYLHPNDVVYVQPGKTRVASTDRWLLFLPTTLSALSLLAIIIRGGGF
ncbi:polysaccharide biosynthesis/export family protein [Tellurirhabdus rosea]|uniref:polysaccharide biosynthesis/export family protein n=1 Tax=Tellurirhabdus rosea TaxID=2674997 RepID=UPI0022541A09|nr:polysaccharide biosynthesis/export family protein [Tellurirhabdus rosea]